MLGAANEYIHEAAQAWFMQRFQTRQGTQEGRRGEAQDDDRAHDLES